MAEDHVLGAAHLLLGAQHTLTSRMADCEQPVHHHVDWKNNPWYITTYIRITAAENLQLLMSRPIRCLNSPHRLASQPSQCTQRTTCATLMRASSLASKRGLSIITLPLGRFTRYEALPKLSCELCQATLVRSK